MNEPIGCALCGGNDHNADECKRFAGELWAVHAQGPDDIYLAFDRADAERHAAELNAIQTPPGISVGAVVIPSPMSPLEHWKELAEQEREHKAQVIARAAQPAPVVPDGFKALLDRIVPRLDAGGPNPIDPEIHHCEWTLYQERERIHAEFAAAPAQGHQVDHIEQDLGMAQHARDSAELRRLCAERDQQWRLRRDAEADRDTANAISSELRAELEAARGLLRESRKSYTEAIHWEDQQPVMKKIDAFLTAFPVPEVRCQTCDGTGDVHRSDGEWLGECHCVKTEQGERQEAVVYAVHAKGAQVDHHCPLVSPDMAADYLPGCATPLYTAPQPAPAQDVAGLVEAAKKADDALSALVRNDQPLETLARKYGSDWSSAIDKVRTELVIQIAAHDKQSGG